MSLTAAAQTASTAPRTPDGRPYLRVLARNTLGRSSGPRRAKEFYPLQEAARDLKVLPPTKPSIPSRHERIAYDFSRSASDRAKRDLENLRTSLIVDPPDGRPAMTPEGLRRGRRAERRKGWTWDSAESTSSRPLSHLAAQNAHYDADTHQLSHRQAPGYVMILV